MDQNISRSGRIRKKSSKLADFESSAEIDMTPVTPTSVGKKKAREQHPHAQMTMTTSQQIKNPATFVDELPPDQLLADDQNMEGGGNGNGFYDPESNPGQTNDEDLDIDIDIKEEDFDNIPYVEDEDDLIEDDFSEDRNVDVEEEDDNSDDSDEGNLMIDDSRGPSVKKGKSKSHRPLTSSIYLSEKSGPGGRKPAAGNSPAGRNRVVRRDKGTRRITAFMLWAKHVRRDVIEANPRMDFSGISKKLGELWSTVSTSEKYTWKRRAKRVSAKEAAATPKQPAQQNSTTIRHTGGHPGRPALSSPQRRHPQSGMTSPSYSKASDSNSHKLVGTQPLDTAAHLKLLGESLSVIGERLTEHEGQIAVSGSLSVLLDSLLCALCPLICLTQQVPELNVVPQETLSRTLDNIAYIMPGL